jgi:hypothetical protein
LPIIRNKPKRGGMKRVDCPIPIWTYEWDEKVQLSIWEKSEPTSTVGQKERHTVIKGMPKARIPTKAYAKIFFLLKPIS